MIFRVPRGSSRILTYYGAVSLLFFVGVDILVDVLLENMPGRQYLGVLLDAGFVLGSVALLRRLLDRQYRRLRRTNEGLESRIAHRTEELRAEVAERSRTEAELRQSVQRFRDIAEASSEWLWEMGPDLRFRYVSKRFSESTGLPADCLLTKNADELFSPAEPTDQPLQAGWMAQHHSFHDQTVILALGEEHRWLSLSGRPVLDANGQFQGYRGTGDDITERRGLDRATAQLRHRHELILNSLGEGVFGLDRDGLFTFINPAAQALLGWSSVELVEKSASHTLSPEPSDGFVISGRGSSQQQHHNSTFRRKDGSLLPVDYVWTTVIEDDQAIGAVVAFRDITEQKRIAAELVAAKERAEASTRAKSSFLAHMSHQLRTPLNSIVGFADVMKNEYFGPVDNERYKDYISDIGRSAAHLSELIEDLVDLARIEAGKLELDEKPTDVAVLVEDALAMVRPIAIRDGCSLQNNVPGNLPPILLDPRRFKQVLLNLLSNAVKFTPAGGRVAVMAEMEPDGGILLRVSDTGVGIAEDELESVTQVFVQGNNAISREKAGAGLGLPLAKQLMELHGGALTIASQTGQGTVVNLYLPPARITARGA